MLTPGLALGPYDVKAVIGKGGQGAVYLVHHRVLRRDDALKVMPLGEGWQSGRAEREAQILARLDHPNIVRLYGAEVRDGELYLFMEHVGGLDLAALISQGALPIAEALDLFQQVVEAVGHAHAVGVVHRDIKPENVLLSAGERRTAKVVDFGIAQILEDSGANARLTGEYVLGTATYMPPEQFEQSRVGPTADIFALGCLLYEMLTGQSPYPARGGPGAIMALKREGQFTPLCAKVAAPVWLGELVAGCLEPEPRRRIQSCDELIRRIQVGGSNAKRLPPAAAADRAAEARLGAEYWAVAAILVPLGLLTLATVAMAAWHGFTPTSPAEPPESTGERTSPDPVVVDAIPLVTKESPKDEATAQPGDEEVPGSQVPSRAPGPPKSTSQPAPSPSLEPEVRSVAPTPRTITLETCPVPREMTVWINGKKIAVNDERLRPSPNEIRAANGDTIRLQAADERPYEVVVGPARSLITYCAPGTKSLTCPKPCAPGSN